MRQDGLLQFRAPQHNDIDNLPIAKYCFRLIATGEIILPRYKGSALHGGFGHALKAIAPAWYQYFFEPRPAPDANGMPHEDALPKPFVLLPPLDENTTYLPGEPFECELTLFGEAAQHISICHAALDYLGTRLGFGSNRGHFRIGEVGLARPSLDETGDVPRSPGALPTAGEIAAALAGLCDSEVTLVFPTRLRLKANNRLSSDPPPFDLFLRRLLGRLNTLSVFYGGGEWIDWGERSALVREAEKVSIQSSDLAWREWERYSGRQGEWMKFGGLAGSITYHGELKAFLPYLAVGEWTHVGGKTSFGLGKYVMLRGDGQ